MNGTHGLCARGVCADCGVVCPQCISTSIENKQFANAMCGISPKNSKKTVRQVMREEEDLFLCDVCGEHIVGPYATIAGDWSLRAKQFHMQCFPKLVAPKPMLENDALDKRLATSPRIFKIADAPDTRHAITEPAPTSVMTYGYVKQLIDSHRELLNTLRFLRQETPAQFLNLPHLDRVITRGENATK